MPTTTITHIRVVVARFHESQPSVIVTDAPFQLNPKAESFTYALLDAANVLESMCRSFDALMTEPGWHHDWKVPAYPWLYHGASPAYTREMLSKESV